MPASMKILFCPRASALRDSLRSQRTLHTFANHTSRPQTNICNEREQFGKLLLKSVFLTIIILT